MVVHGDGNMNSQSRMLLIGLWVFLGGCAAISNADSVEYQRDDLGGQLRQALLQKTGLKTIPQIFIGGEHVGGATELFDAARDGRLQTLLEDNDVNWNREISDDPYSFLPKWLHKR